MRSQINFRVSEEEKSRWEKAASKAKLPLGTWIKNALNSAAGKNPPKEIAFDLPPGELPPPADADRAESAGSGPAPDGTDAAAGEGTPKVKKGKTCEHGVPKGHRCWRCGGKAKT